MSELTTAAFMLDQLNGKTTEIDDYLLDDLSDKCLYVDGREAKTVTEEFARRFFRAVEARNAIEVIATNLYDENLFAMTGQYYSLDHAMFDYTFVPWTDIPERIRSQLNKLA